MIDVKRHLDEKAGPVANLVKTHGIDLQRALRFSNVLQETSRPAISMERMPNGDPPSVVLWGTEE